MNPNYTILTESSCDLSPALAEQMEVEVLPLSFTMGEKNYPHHLDGRDFPIDRFYARMRGGDTAVTAAANVTELSDGMEIHLKEGRDVLFLCFSSGLSSTRNSCAIAAEELREKYP
ncbi:MAG: DegV family protein, partial [Oscillibacter sp.]